MHEMLMMFYSVKLHVKSLAMSVFPNQEADHTACSILV